MEYLDGLDLETLVQLAGPQRPARVLHVLRQVAGALAEAHAAGLVHRDIKPANIILCERGGVADVAKVLDFGLVRELDPGTPGLSGAADVMGTPLFMAPEAISDPRSVDGRSDIYAVGAVAYWMLTATLPFEGTSVLAVLARALHEPVIPPSLRVDSDIPRDLEDVVMSCLEKDPDRRPASAGTLAEQLAAVEGVPPWEEIDARAWWKAHAEVIASRRKAPELADSGPCTVCVARRGAATVAERPRAQAG
jgi:serine/threonine-protein kinase